DAAPPCTPLGEQLAPRALASRHPVELPDHPGGARAQKKALRQAVTGRTGERGATVHLGAPGDGGGGDGLARAPALAVRFWAGGLVPTRRAPARACPPAPVASAAGQRGARLLDPGGGTLPPCLLQGGPTSGWWEPSWAQGAPVRGTSPRRRPERLQRAWQPEEGGEHGPMLPGAWPLIEPQHGATRRGCAVLCMFCQSAGAFPRAPPDVPLTVVDHVASHGGVPADTWTQDAGDGRTIAYHRAQLRQHLGCRDATGAAGAPLVPWLSAQRVPPTRRPAHLTAAVGPRGRASASDEPA